jgi:transcriptional regulator NrdR family protein
MNYYGKSPLEMHCPHCGTYGAHRVIRTEARWYHWGGESIEMFKRIAGKDISYRRRVKRCSKCARSFVSAEMAHIFLEALVKEVMEQEARLEFRQKALNSLLARFNALEADQKETHKAIRAASKVLHRRLPKRKGE